MNVDSPLGIFDSGLGGLTVVKAIQSYLPNEDLIYIGDTAHFPYGNKSRETIERYSLQNSRYLINEGVKMLIIACNSASALGIDAVRREIDLPVLEVVGPGARTAVKVSGNKRIGVIGTRGTIMSSSYVNALKKTDPAVEVFPVPTPLLVPLAEEGWSDSDITFQVAEIYLKTLKERDIDTLILGCTHYPLIKNIIQKVMGESVALVDSADAIAAEAKEILTNKKIGTDKKTPGTIKYYTTDSPESFKETGTRLIDLNLDNTKQIFLPTFDKSRPNQSEIYSG